MDCTTADQVRMLAKQVIGRQKLNASAPVLVSRQIYTELVIEPPSVELEPVFIYPAIDCQSYAHAYAHARRKAIYSECYSQKTSTALMYKHSYFTHFEIIEAADDAAGFIAGTIVSGGTEDKLVKWRMPAIWLIRRLTNLSSVKIGFIFNRDHSTILHSAKCVDKNPEKFRRQVTAIREALCNGK